VDLNQEDSYLRSAGAAALVSSKAGRAAKVGLAGGRKREVLVLGAGSTALPVLACGRAEHVWVWPGCAAV
jgi:hypothetical protein